MDPATTEKLLPPPNSLVSKFDIVNVLGDAMVQVGVVDTLVPVALKQVPVELAMVY
jgi:hypothetical protein